MHDNSPRCWLITGAGSGLGRALAQVAFACGDRVAGGIRDPDVREEFGDLAPGQSLGVELDVTNSAAVERAVAETESTFGGIDVLVNNAGYQLIGAIEELDSQELRDQFEVNVFGALAMIRAVLPGMRARRRGQIINITSVSGLATWAGTGAYCASKFALEAIGGTLAEELAPLGIGVMNVAPGGLRTRFTGRSTRRASRRIDDYAVSAHVSEQIIADGRGREPGDPLRAAQAIMTALNSKTPPAHLLLGADALYYHGRKAGAMQAEIARWAPLSVGISAEG
ncbi:MAG: SDR family NAD(P)-dependent oxidoreductase [Gammaproteobacteria bacterium]|nr:MAG: SDR family NAD(P)-dependent oxidoreductase [Gammaproteobacteria bacterium]